MKESITFESQGFKLVGTLYRALDEKASALLIAGGGNTHRAQGYYHAWQEEFAKKGITTFNFDFRGVGEAEGGLNESNLNTRVQDAHAALEILRLNSNTKNIFLVGTSMGGPVAIRIVDPTIQGLLLCVPAAYSLESRDKNFGPDFSEAIRKPESWKGSPEFDDLRQYSGNTFLLYGDKDEVIPSDVFLTYAEIIKEKGDKVTVIQDADHRSWWKDEEKGKYALDQMNRFILEHSLI